MSAPVGRREFFALEAGEYLERLTLLTTGLGSPDAEQLVRYARALRGAALMAGPPGYATAAAAIENLAKAIRDGTLGWSPAVAARLSDTLESCKGLLRQVREWSEVDAQRCERLADQLDLLVGSGGTRGGGPAGTAADITAGVRAYVAREAAAVAATLEQVAEAVEERPAPDSAEPVARRLQPLRGLGALPGLSPLPELLEALDLTVAIAGKGGAWPPATASAFRASALALARMARDIAELGMPQHDSHEVVQATVELREAFGGDDDVVPVTSLYVDGDPDPVVRQGAPPAAPAVATGPAIELVSLADRLRHAADQADEGPSVSARALQLHALVLSLRGLAMSPPVGASCGNLLSRIDRETMAGRALDSGDAFAALIRRAADQIAAAADGDALANLGVELAPLCDELDRLAGIVPPTAAPPPGPPAAEPVGEAAPVVPIEMLAPEPEPDVIPIETLFFAPAPAGSPELLPFEQTFSTYFRLLREESAAAPKEIVPIEALAPEPVAVPIQNLFYRGRRALERADVVRRELNAALRARRDLSGVETLLTELLDLVPLALDDDR